MAVSLDPARAREGAPAWRFTYHKGKLGRGGAQAEISPPQWPGMVECWAYKHSSGPRAVLHVRLLEADGDAWAHVAHEANSWLSQWAEGWHHIQLYLADFTFEPSGNRRRQQDTINRLRFDFSEDEADVSIVDLRFLPAGPGAARAGEWQTLQEGLLRRFYLDLAFDEATVNRHLSGDWLPPNEQGRFIGAGGLARLSLPLPEGKRRDYCLAVTAHAGGPSPQVRILAAGEEIAACDLSSERNRLFRLPAEKTASLDQVELEFRNAGREPSGPIGRIELLSLAASPLGRALRQQGEHAVVGLLEEARDEPTISVNWLAGLLSKEGYQVERLKLADLLNPFVLTRGKLDILLLPQSGAYPAWGRPALLDFLRSGGDLVTLSEYPLDTLLTHQEGRWFSLTELRSARGISSLTLGDPEPGEWLSGDWSQPEEVFHFWAPSAPVRWTGRKAQAKLPILSRQASILRLAVGCNSPCKLRISANGALLGKWEAKKGAALLEFPVAENLLSGDALSLTFDSEGAEQGVAVAWVSLEPQGGKEAKWREKVALLTRPLNTGRGDASQDRLQVSPDQVGLFDSSYPLVKAAYLAAAPGQFFLSPRFRLAGDFPGNAATALLGNNQPILAETFARLIPLLNAYDRRGRLRGPAASVVHHYAGQFQGSSWLAFGVKKGSLFDPKNPASATLLLAGLKALRAKAFLTELKTDFACYRRGEAVRISAQAYNRSESPQNLSWQVDLYPEGSGKRYRLPPGKQAVAFPPGKGPLSDVAWEGPLTAPFYRVEATLFLNGRPSDRVQTGFVVWDDALLRRGPRVGIRDSYLTVNGRASLVIGANMPGAMVSSPQENPLRWKRDFARMRENGFGLLKILHLPELAVGRLSVSALSRPSEQTLCKLDALVQLAQQHGIILELSLLDRLPIVLSPADLETAAAWAKAIAARYRAAPGVIFQLQTEPIVSSQASSPTQGLQELLPWSRRLTRAIKEAKPEALTTVGFQQYYQAADYVRGAQDLDFNSYHYYGNLPSMPLGMALADRRLEGKPLILGEFGLLAHPAWPRTEFTGLSIEEASWQLLLRAHYGLGLGAGALLNWTWRDFSEVIFPWGILHPDDLVPKQTFFVLRNLALLLRGWRPAFRPAPVYLLLPDNYLSDPQADDLVSAKQQVEKLLAQQAEFGVALDADSGRLPKGTLIFTPASKEVRIPVEATNPVSPRSPDLHVFRLNGTGGQELWVLLNRGKDRKEVMVGNGASKVQMTLAANRPGLLWLDKRRLLAVEASGPVWADGVRLVDSRQPFMLRSLDGQDLRISKALLLLPLQAGRFSPCRPGLTAEVGEFQGGKWRSLEELRSLGQNSCSQFLLSDPFPGCILLSAKGERQAARKLAERLLASD